jgi:DNA end-binding protein Ku
VAIVQFALREKTRLGALRIKDDVLVLQSLLWPDEVREANFPSLEADVRISAQERDMSAALVESMAADFDPASFTDDYQVQLRQLIEAKLEQGESLDTEETFGVEAGEGSKGEVIDLMEALKRSLDRKRGSGSAGTPDDEAGGDSGDAAGDGEEEAKPARKRSTAAKPAAAKSAEKPAVRKTSAAKPAGDKAGAAKSSEAKGAASKSAAAKSTAEKPAAKTAAGKATGTRARKPA